MRTVALCVAAITLAACGPSVSGDDDDDIGIDARVDGPLDGPGTDGDQLDFSKVYAHSGERLYRLDTTTLTPVEIGPFGLVGTTITDIAVDRNDRMLGISLDNIYTIDVATGAATLLRAFDAAVPNLTSLSFVPRDLANPDGDERLVAATDTGAVLDIDETTGMATPLGNYGLTAAGGLQIKSSGDIVAIAGFGIYATVTVGANLDDPDYLARIDPTTWAATLIGGGTPHDKIFGVGFWRNKLYGFIDTGSTASPSGAIVELDVNTGVATPVNTGAIRWWGAGVTTDAPVID